MFKLGQAESSAGLGGQAESSAGLGCQSETPSQVIPVARGWAASPSQVLGCAASLSPVLEQWEKIARPDFRAKAKMSCYSRIGPSPRINGISARISTE